ncbi:snoaL-like domain-containing protein [Sarocladium implicatum]|nr:snoaL-like domain-containing protein [Sarocladium implicatum]
MPALLDTAQALFDALAAFDTKRMGEILDPSYEHTFAPSSEEFGPPIGKQAFIERFAGISPVLTGIVMKPVQSWANDQTRTVTIHATGAPTFRDTIKAEEDVKDEWDFSGEYMFVFTMDESGEKIVKTFEFVEGKVATKMKAQIPKAFMRLSGAS